MTLWASWPLENHLDAVGLPFFERARVEDATPAFLLPADSLHHKDLLRQVRVVG